MVNRLAVVFLLTFLPACGGGGGSPSAPQAPPPTTTPTPVPPAPSFGPGQYLVNSRISPGRYFADPVSGCYWVRLRGLGGTLGEIIANDFVGFDARQIIVDILPTDLAFETDAQCGSWYDTPRHGAQTTITPGVWLVGAQITAGTYQATVGNGCYWERLRHFDGTLSGIIANDFIATGGPRLVSIAATDVGFTSDGDCGTWTAASAGVEAFTLPTSDALARARALNRAAAELPAEDR